jgi:hypothetical protein
MPTWESFLFPFPMPCSCWHASTLQAPHITNLTGLFFCPLYPAFLSPVRHQNNRCKLLGDRTHLTGTEPRSTTIFLYPPTLSFSVCALDCCPFFFVTWPLPVLDPTTPAPTSVHLRVPALSGTFFAFLLGHSLPSLATVSGHVFCLVPRTLAQIRPIPAANHSTIPLSVHATTLIFTRPSRIRVHIRAALSVVVHSSPVVCLSHAPSYWLISPAALHPWLLLRATGRRSDFELR